MAKGDTYKLEDIIGSNDSYNVIKSEKNTTESLEQVRDKDGNFVGYRVVQNEKPKVGEKGAYGVLVGVGKGVGSTVKGLGQLGEQIMKVLPEVARPEPFYTGENAPIENTILSEENLQAQGGAEKFGKTLEQVGEFIVPGSKVASGTRGLSKAAQIGAQALTSGTVASVQEGKIGKDAAIAAASEAVLPGVARVAKPVIGIGKRLMRGFGSALSGAGTDVIKQIADNPQFANQVTKELKEKGASAIAEKNANQFIDAIKSVQRRASTEYGNALESLSDVPVSKEDLSKTMREFAEEFGISKETGELVIDGAEFFQPRNIKKATSAVEIVNNIEDFSGKNIRDVLKRVDDMKYKTTNTEEARAFNSFIDDLSNRLRDSIAKSSPILEEANINYSSSKNLIEGAQQIISKTKFGGSSDIVKVSNALDSLFGKNALSGKYLDDFLEKAGIDPEDFKTSEAVRQISEISQGGNNIGTNLFELIRSVTGSVISPEMVRDITIKSGMAEEALLPVLQQLSDPMRKVFIKGILEMDN